MLSPGFPNLGFGVSGFGQRDVRGLNPKPRAFFLSIRYGFPHFVDQRLQACPPLPHLSSLYAKSRSGKPHLWPQTYEMLNTYSAFIETP